jgi:hypothetical protein
MLLSPPTLHATEPKDIIEYRQHMMKAIGGHAGVERKMMTSGNMEIASVAVACFRHHGSA